MSKRAATKFLARLREALTRYATGVHDVGDAADTATIAAVERRLSIVLPESMTEVYRFANGMWLFDDVVRLLPLDDVEARDGSLRYGVTDGISLWVDAEGRAYELDDDGDRVLVAVSIEEDLLARIAREGLLIDDDGEWRDVFGPDGELLPAVQRKRNEIARKRAPTSARWLLEAAELALEIDGDPSPFLVEARALDPVAPGPAELHGLLLSGRGELEAGAAALADAATHSGPVRQAERAAIAAEAAQRAGQTDVRAKMAALAIEREPGIVARLGEEAESALQHGRLEDGDRLGALARAVAGDAGGVTTRLRLREKLRSI
ncbi:MAG: hypothetical protein ABI321_06480 [Polyangia bacterium]